MSDEDLLAYIAAFHAAHGYAPSVRDIRAGLGMGQGTVAYRIGLLEAEGRVQRAAGTARTITVTA